jgi:hypothetical protein
MQRAAPVSRGFDANGPTRAATNRAAVDRAHDDVAARDRGAASRGYDLSRVPARAHAVGDHVTFTSPGDGFEREADDVARRVMRGPHDAGGAEARSGARVPALPSPAPDPGFEAQGRPLDAAPRAAMEARFGRNFGGVRVHTDGRAAEAAQAMNAAAFTLGHDIAFGPGRYDPHSVPGRLLLAHELTHVLQSGGRASVLMRQALSSDPKDGGATGDTGLREPHRCEADLELDAQYKEWLEYDPVKDAEETALVARINNEVFGPINQERNRIADESYGVATEQENAFPANVLDFTTATEAQKTLFNAPSYKWLHRETDPESRGRRSDWFGSKQALGDLTFSGKVTPQRIGTHEPPHTLWSYKEDKPEASELEKTAVSGYAEFKAPHGQTVFVPQLGFGWKPPVDKRQLMCKELPVVKPGRAKRTRRGRAGQRFARRLRRLFQGGRDPQQIGVGRIFGVRNGEDGRPAWWHAYNLPPFGGDVVEQPGPDAEYPVQAKDAAKSDDSVTGDSDADEPKHGRELPNLLTTRELIEKTMNNRALKLLAEKKKSYEALKTYYIARTAYIAQYQSFLK